jgi:stage II sporulation protein AA (anti-sigma F factor antagonist)
MTGESSTPSTISQREVDGVAILAPQRGLKGEAEWALRERLNALVARGKLEILIDMKAMPYADSSELGRLIRSHISVRQAGGRVRLCHLSPRVATLMHLTKLDTVLDIYDTEEEALSSIRLCREEKPHDSR